MTFLLAFLAALGSLLLGAEAPSNGPVPAPELLALDLLVDVGELEAAVSREEESVMLRRVEQTLALRLPDVRTEMVADASTGVPALRLRTARASGLDLGTLESIATAVRAPLPDVPLVLAPVRPK
ncbi:MAG: hypothetical protein AAGB93_22210 [Planctomycetota bacterium]